MTDDWPEHSAELDRKTIDVLTLWSGRYDRGRISKREFFILLTGLYDATSGLIPKATSDMMANLHLELRS